VLIVYDRGHNNLTENSEQFYRQAILRLRSGAKKRRVNAIVYQGYIN
jgi:hypothetical protein